MSNIHETHVSAMRIRKRLLSQEEHPQIQWEESVSHKRGDGFFRNLAVAAALVLCAVTLRRGALPSWSDATDVVMAAAADQSLLDDQLGKLSFVSALFPEAVLVFGEQHTDHLALPVSGGMVTHAWSEGEPYMSWRTDSRTVYSAAEGEVIGVYHGNNDEHLVQVLGKDRIACLYGNLSEVAVRTGDAIEKGDRLGTLLPGADCVFEVRNNGVSMDPALFLAQ